MDIEPVTEGAVGSSDSIVGPVTADLDNEETHFTSIRGDLRALAGDRLFWIGTSIKLLAALVFGAEVATRWFAPFVYEFVHHPLTNTYATFVQRGEPLAFPYGPGMLLVLAIPWVPTAIFSFDPSSFLGLFLLRLPLFGADLLIAVLLMRWLRIPPRMLVIGYWLSPIVFFATYVHGQLDLIPTALLCLSLSLLFDRRRFSAAMVFGFALATKAHLLIAAPFLFVYLYRIRRMRRIAGWSLLVAATTALLLYAFPLTSWAFRTMVLGTSESLKIWAFSLPYGLQGPMLYAAPGLLTFAFLVFAGFRKLTKEMTLMFMGVVFIGIVALMPPQPGWFIWSAPFVAYVAAQYRRTRRIALIALPSAYILYFTISAPHSVLGALDPLFGAGAGTAVATSIQAFVPQLFREPAVGLAWTFLFASSAAMGFEMYRRGVQSSAVYGFRDQSFMIGIGGDSGAGKHTVGADLADVVGRQLTLLHGDDDHRWERGDPSWSRYTHLDPRGNTLGLQYASLAALRRGARVHRRHYDHDRGAFTNPIAIEPNNFIAIIGLHPFYLPAQRQVFHLKIFVDPVEAIRREWKVIRDMKKRGYSRDEVMAQIKKRLPDSERFVAPQRRYADLIIRHCSATTRGSEVVDVEFEMLADLDTMSFQDHLKNCVTITVDWDPDEALQRDRLRVRGTMTAEAVFELATTLIPNLDELIDFDAWQPGGSGIVQVAMVHAISAQLRSGNLT